MLELPTKIDLQITTELNDLLLISNIHIQHKALQVVINKVDPIKTYLKIICNKSFRKAIESLNTPLEDTKEEVGRLLYKLLLDRYYDSQIELTNASFKNLQVAQS